MKYKNKLNNFHFKNKKINIKMFFLKISLEIIITFIFFQF